MGTAMNTLKKAMDTSQAAVDLLSDEVKAAALAEVESTLLPDEYEDLTPEQEASLPEVRPMRSGPGAQYGKYEGEYGDKFMVASSAVGGETPEQAIETREKMIDERMGGIDKNDARFESIMGSLSSAHEEGLDIWELRKTFELIGQGKLRFTDGAKQREAVAFYDELKNTPSPNPRGEGYTGLDRVGFGHGEDRYRENLSKDIRDVEEAFPETKKEGPKQRGYSRVE